MYYVCCSLPHGKEDQTLLIEDEPCKVRMQNGMVFFLVL
jgi:hypothetical protein